MANSKKRKAVARASSNGANIGFGAELWQLADAFEEQHAKLKSEKKQGADPENPDECRALNIFWAPVEGRCRISWCWHIAGSQTDEAH